MPVSKTERFLPYTGVLAGILFGIAGFVPKVSEKYADPHAVQIMNDNAGRNVTGLIAGAFFCVAMLFFASVIRSALRASDGAESPWASAAFGGGVLVAASGATSAWIMMAGLDAADHHDKAALNALSYLGIDGWLPWVAASAVFFLATGIGATRSGLFPRWFAITTTVLGVLCMLGPAGIAVYFVTPLWLIAASVLLARKPSAPVAAEAVA